jgi:chromate transporter
VTAILAGIAPVIVAIVADATVGLGRAVLRGRLLALTAAGALIASLAGVPDVVILLAGAAAGLATARLDVGGVHGWVSLAGLGGAIGATATGVGAGAIGLGGLFVACLKMGAVLFGSGYLLVALLRDEFVIGTALLTERELIDAIAVGQMSPGPVFTTATFVGFLLLGLPGALVATLGFALPAYVFVAASVPVLDRLRRSPAARAALAGVSAAVVGLLIGVSAALGRTAIVDPVSGGLAALALLLLATGRTGPVALLALGGAVGALRGVIGAA